MGDLTGTTLGNYRIIEKLGRGGMATVYKAFQPSLERYVAIKVIHEQLAAEDEQFVKRFQREAKAVASLRHGHIVQVFDFGVENGQYYMVMEYLDGITLKTRLSQLSDEGKVMSLEEVGMIFNDVAGAVAHAHSQGMIHRDLKPANIILTTKGESILTDFGIARIAGGAQYTSTGVVVGTPDYLSPEQGRGEQADHRSDLYALGVVLYEMVTGRVPFSADTPLAVILKHISDPLPMPRQINPEVPESIEQIILKALAKEPKDRYQKVDDMSKALARAIAGETAVKGAQPAPQAAAQPATPPMSPAAPAPASLPPAPAVAPTPMAPAAPQPPPAPTVAPMMAASPRVAPTFDKPAAPGRGPAAPAVPLPPAARPTGGTPPPGALYAPAQPKPRRGLCLALGVGGVVLAALMGGILFIVLLGGMCASSGNTPSDGDVAPLDTGDVLDPNLPANATYFSSDFSTNNLFWKEGVLSDEYSDDDIRFVDGLYLHTMTSKRAMLWQGFLPGVEAADVWLELDATLVDTTATPGDASLSLIFRQNKTDESYYRIRFSDTGYYMVLVYQGGKQRTIQDWQYSESINIGTGARNTFAVQAIGSVITVYANGIELGSVVDETLTAPGGAAVGIGLANAGATLTVEFHYVEIRAPY